MDCWWEAGCDAVNATVEFVEDDVIPVAREGVEVAGELATGAGENIQQTMALAAGGEDQMVAVRNDQTMGREADRRIATREATTEMIEQAAEVFAAERNKIITAAEDYLDCIERLDHFMQQLTDELIEMNIMPEALRTNRKYFGSVEHYGAGYYSQKMQKMMSWKNQSAEVGSDGMTMGAPSSWGDQVGTSPLENTYSKEWLNSTVFKEQNYGCIGSVEDQTNEWWSDHRFKQWCWFANGTNFPLTVNNLYPDFKLDQVAVDADMTRTSTALIEGYPHGWLTNLAMLYFTVGTLTYNDPWSEGGETLQAEGPGRDPHQVEPGNPSGKFPWGSFTRRQVVAFKTGGADTMMGFSNIMQHNHGDTDGMAPQSFFDYSEQSSMREVGNSAEHCDVNDLTVEPGYLAYLHGDTESGLGYAFTENAEVKQYANKATWAYSTMYGVLWANNIYGQQPQGSPDYGRGGTGAFPDYVQTNYVWTPSACAKRMRSMGETFKSMSGEYALPGMSALGELMVNAGNAINTLITEADDYVWDIKECHERIQAGLCQVARDSPGFPEDWADNFNTDATQQAYQDALAAIGDLELAAVGGDFTGEGQEAVIFKEQCFLLSFIGDIASYKKHKLDTGIDNYGDVLDGRAKKRLPYYTTDKNPEPMAKNASLLVDGQSYSFLNILTQHPSMSVLHEIKNHELSNLQPRLKLWKVIFDEDGNERDIEIKFNTHYNSKELDLLQSTAVRNAGSGLKSFNFVYDGSNPFSVKKSIKGNLKIFANSFMELLQNRPGSFYKKVVDADGNESVQQENTTYTYLDLVMKTWNTEIPEEERDRWDVSDENTNRQELNFRLKAQIGLSAPMNEMSSMSEEIRSALSESFVTLNLTPTVHNFEFDEQGRVIMNVNYLAYIEQFFDQKHFNVFADPDISMKRFKREFKMTTYRRECSSDQVNQVKEDFAKQVDNETQTAIASLTRELLNRNQIYYLELPWSKVRNFLSFGPHATYDEFFDDAGGFNLGIVDNAGHNGNIQTRVNRALSNAFGQGESGGIDGDEKTMNSVRAALLNVNPEATDLAFFYLSDLIDIIMLKIENELEAVSNELEELTELSASDDQLAGGDIKMEDIEAKIRDLRNAGTGFKSLRVMLGPLEITHPSPSPENTSLFVNLGDVPVSVKYFIGWITERMLRKEEVFYPFTKFVNDLLNNLVRTFLNNDDCFGYSVKQKTRLNQSAITCYSDSDEYDPVTLRMIELQSENASAQNSAFPDEYYLPRVGLSNFTNMPILNVSGPNGARSTIPAEHSYNFFVFFAGRVMPTEFQTGHKETDNAAGIFHYAIGRDRGLVKNIQLTKTQTKGLAEVRFEQEGFDNLEQLRVIYDAKIEMYANVQAFPGTYIFIDPKGFDPAMPVGLGTDGDPEFSNGGDPFGLTDLGIGGYYMIIRSEHEFSEGKANTILNAKWVAALDSDEEHRQNRAVEDGTGDGGRSNRNCSIVMRADPEEDAASDAPGFLGMLGGS